MIKSNPEMIKAQAGSHGPATGLVIRCSKNHFIVRVGDDEIECRIKGKILKGRGIFYNPLAPGDFVEIEDSLILAVKDRVNLFARFNQKGQKAQVLAANVDIVLCVCSISSPPWRPRFLDRVLLQADAAGIPAAIICNKYDLADEGGSLLADPDLEERLSDFARIGYPVFRISALTGEGLDGLKRFIAGKHSVMVGQSGVGKSSLINALVPGLNIKIGPINEKFDRGNHTTTQSVLLDVPALPGNPEGWAAKATRIIDTPGIRRFVPAGVEADNIILYMKEFAPLSGKCSYGHSCSHVAEPGCKILEAVNAGAIHEDRYDSFLRIRDELNGKNDYPDLD